MTPRERVIAEAESFIGTGYHHMGRVKGVGVDCFTLLCEVYERAGIIPHVKIPFYAHDFFAHRDAELYIDGLLGYAREIEGPPQPGDVVLFKIGRVFSHGAIVVSWPRVIHAWYRNGVHPVDADQGQLKGREMRFFDPFPA